MSMVDSIYSDYGLTETGARRRRVSQNTANTLSASMGQKRGRRDMQDLTKRLMEGYKPVASGYGSRGLANQNVSSGIQRAGLTRYALDMSQQLGRQAEDFQLQQQGFVNTERDQVADLDSYLEERRLQKQQNIIDSAAALQQYARY